MQPSNWTQILVGLGTAMLGLVLPEFDFVPKEYKLIARVAGLAIGSFLVIIPLILHMTRRDLSWLFIRRLPPLSIEFSVVTYGSWDLLVCRVFNRPSSRRRKAAHEIFIDGDVFEHENNRLVSTFDRPALARAFSQGEVYTTVTPVGYTHPDLEPSEFPLVCAIVGRTKREGTVMMWAGGRVSLPVPGRYRIMLVARCHEGRLNARAVFTVTPTALTLIP